MKTKPPSLATIAAAARVSVSTVSRALRGSPALPDRTIRRIQRVASRLGYRQN
ncbi:MAG: helix-turn-helix domain-containing protein [Opitutaceae bacterium]|nr:helix-turn-helix domain-containing protein [Opitutaceae bacterium]